MLGASLNQTPIDTDLFTVKQLFRGYLFSRFLSLGTFSRRFIFADFKNRKKSFCDFIMLSPIKRSSPFT